MERIKIRQGKTYQKTVRWGASPLVYRPISNIANTAPVRITAPDHGLPPRWPVAIMGAAGLTELNAKSNPPRGGDFHPATTIDDNIFEINTRSAERFRAYAGGGHVVYYTPVSLANYTARFVIRDRVGGAVLFEGSSSNGVVVLNDDFKQIDINIAAEVTASFEWKKGVFELELEDSFGYVPSAFPLGEVEVTKEIAT